VKVWKGNQANRGVKGMFGIEERNEVGEQLLDFCYVSNVCITNSQFKQFNASRYWTWNPLGFTIPQSNSLHIGPRAGSGVIRIDPLHFLAGCRTRRLNQV